MKGRSIDEIVNTTEVNPAPWPVVVGLYVRQRFSPAIFGLLSLYLFVFIKAGIAFNAADIADLSLIVIFLFIMRLYDDLRSMTFDLGTGRIYTEPGPAKTLRTVFIIASLALVALTTVFDRISGAVLIIFLIVNHTLYHFLVVKHPFRYYLPLIKYPVLAGMVSLRWDVGHLALFFAFLTFDIIDDATFPVPKWAAVVTALAAFGLTMSTVSADHFFIAGVAAAVATPLAATRTKYSAYVFLILLLLAKLIDPLYEI